MDEIPLSENNPPKPEENQVVAPKRRASKKPFFVLLVILLVAAAAFGAWYYQQRKIDDLNKQLNAATSQQAQEEPIALAEVRLVGPVESSFTVALPDTWVFGVCADSEILFLAPSADKLGRCNSESFGTISIQKVAGDIRPPEVEFTNDVTLESIVYGAVEINGLPGVKVSYTVKTDQEMGALAGTKAVRYTLFKDGISYNGAYQRLSGEPDYTAVFEDVINSFVLP